MPLHHKRVYEPPADGDGHRLLVMRYWPRGVPRARVDEWRRELAPSPELLRAFRAGRLSWEEFARSYREEVLRGAPDALEELRRRARRETITLLCGCPDPARCHRTLLLALLRTSASSVEPGRRR